MPPARIQDEFTDLPISYSRKQQLRRVRDGLCYRRGNKEPVPGRKLCPPCLVATRERARKREGYRRRIAGAASYTLQGAEGSTLLKDAAAVVAERALARERKRLERHKLEVRATWAALGKTGPVRGGRTPIQDEFSNLPVSRQRKYQLRRQKAGLCTMCGAPAVQSTRCLKHLVAARERLRNWRQPEPAMPEWCGWRFQEALCPPTESSDAYFPASCGTKSSFESFWFTSMFS